MTAKCTQNTHEKAQPEWVENSKLFNKCDASISLHTNLTKWKKYQKVTKNKTKINILKKIPIKVALK